MSIVFSLILIFFSSQSFSLEEKWAMKGAVSTGTTIVKGFDLKTESTPTVGFSTHFGARIDKFEINASSFVVIGWIDRIRHSINNNNIGGSGGDGNFRSVSFGPTIRYYLHDPRFSPTWQSYLTTGALWGIQTFSLENNSIYRHQDEVKITYEASGFILGFGVEEQISKNLKPAFIELAYKYLKTYEVSIVGGKPTLVNVIETEDTEKPLVEQSITLSFGLTFF